MPGTSGTRSSFICRCGCSTRAGTSSVQFLQQDADGRDLDAGPRALRHGHALQRVVEHLCAQGIKPSDLLWSCASAKRAWFSWKTGWLYVRRSSSMMPKFPASPGRFRQGGRRLRPAASARETSDEALTLTLAKSPGPHDATHQRPDALESVLRSPCHPAAARSGLLAPGDYQHTVDILARAMRRTWREHSARTPADDLDLDPRSGTRRWLANGESVAGSCDAEATLAGGDGIDRFWSIGPGRHRVLRPGGLHACAPAALRFVGRLHADLPAGRRRRHGARSSDRRRAQSTVHIRRSHLPLWLSFSAS